MPEAKMMHPTSGTNLAEILEKVLDKGVVIAGDISISVGGVELLTIKIRLLIASVDKALEMGINWWQTDPYLCSKAKEAEREKEIEELKAEVKNLKSEA